MGVTVTRGQRLYIPLHHSANGNNFVDPKFLWVTHLSHLESWSMVGGQTETEYCAVRCVKLHFIDTNIL
jgi:hypothetical protein